MNMHRRHFLQLTSAAALIPSVAKAADAPKICIGQIGTAHAHASGKMTSVRGLPDLYEVVGIAEPDSARWSGAEKASAYQGLKRVSEAELISDKSVAVVVVETAIEDSVGAAMRCLEAGKHIHLDKPGALQHVDFKRMRTLAAERDLTVQMGYMLRYNPAFEFLFHAVRSGWLGEITEIDAAMGKLADARTREAIKTLPGGGMFELGCHMIDAVVTLLGRPSSVEAISTPTRDDGVADNQVALLHYAKATAVLRCNHADPFGGPRRRFMVAGTEGVIDIQPLESGKFTLSLTQKRDQWNKGSQQVSREVSKDRYLGEFQDLARVVRGEKKLAWDAAHDIAVHETTLLASGQKV